MSGIAPPGGSGGGGGGGLTLLDAEGAGLQAVSVVLPPITVLASAYTEVALGIPAGCMLLSLGGFTTTSIPTAATYNVGTGGDNAKYANAVGSAHGTNWTMWNNPVIPQGQFITDGTEVIRITPNVVPGSASGVVTVHAIYWVMKPPTS